MDRDRDILSVPIPFRAARWSVTGLTQTSELGKSSMKRRSFHDHFTHLYAVSSRGDHEGGILTINPIPSVLLYLGLMLSLLLLLLLVLTLKPFLDEFAVLVEIGGT